MHFSRIMKNMIWKMKATDPPKPRTSYASRVALGLGGVMVLMVLLHLVRIDKLIPVLGEILGAGAVWFVALIVIVEVLAVPYLIGMKLSPLFRVMSGLFAVLAPLAWSCLVIWAHGNGHSTGEFSSYLHAPSSWWLIALNFIWLAASYWILGLLNFDAAFSRLRKKH